MTLCVLWRYQKDFALATDSKLSITGGSHFDLAPKLFAIHAEVSDSIDNQSPSSNCIYRHVLALALTTEDYSRAIIYKDIFAQTCRNFRYVGKAETMPFTHIVDIAASLYEYIMKEVRAGYYLQDLPDVFLAGWCGENQKVRAFKITGPDESTTRPHCVECLISDSDFEFEAIGSGTQGMEKKVLDHLKTSESIHVNMVRWLQELIDANEVLSIGGAIQYGQFENGDFKIYGILYPPNAESNGQPRLLINNIEPKKVKLNTAVASIEFTGAVTYPFPFHSYSKNLTPHSGSPIPTNPPSNMDLKD